MSTNISLTPELEEYAKDQVASGLYGSVSEFMREAVRMHRMVNLEHRLYIRELHNELTQAASEIDNNETEPHNMREIMDEVHSEQAKQRK